MSGEAKVLVSALILTWAAVLALTFYDPLVLLLPRFAELFN